jgi:PAS domain-containing protein
MIAEDPLTTICAIAISIIAAGLIIAFLWRIMPGGSGMRAPPPVLKVNDGVVFHFEGSRLADATPKARQLMTNLSIDRAELNSLSAHLARKYPCVTERIDSLRQSRNAGSGVVIRSQDKNETLRLELAHGILRLTIAGPDDGVVPEPEDRPDAAQQELAILRCIAEDAPQLIWRVDSDLRVSWANRAYLALSDRLVPKTAGGDPMWPSRSIIPDLRPVEEEGAALTQRVPLMLPDLTEPLWFEVTSVRRGTSTVHFAVDTSMIIQAEAGPHKFIQTLTKTFAHLSIGLAIFDKDRRLVLFNPAFLDLTGLPVGFLSGRPQVNSVLDRLRDINMLPEPKNYPSWRDQMAALEAAAVRGTYCETWSLPSGQTYRVTGRPHPDGAIAFLFEDITNEILLTRSFRSELETAQSVIDSLDEGIAVFSQAGTLTIFNRLYTKIWGHGTIGLSDIGIHDEMALWKSRAMPTATWEHLQQSIDGSGDRQRWQERIRLMDGRTLVCRFAPLIGGATLIGFSSQAEDAMLPIHIGSDTAPPVQKARAQQRPRVVAGV